MERSVRRGFGALAAAQLAIVTTASIASVASFKAVFIDWDFMVSAVIGGVGAAAVVAISWSKKLLVGETLAIAAVGLVVLGTVATGGVPTPDAFVTFARGLVSGWAELLSLSPQFDDTAELRVLPFLLAWIAAMLGGELLHRTSQPTLPAIGPLVGLTISALVTAENRTIATIQGIVIAVGALVVGRAEYLARRSVDEVEVAEDDTDQRINAGGADVTRARRQWVGRLARAVAACTVVGITAPLIGPRLPFADANDRFDLRDRRVPPWDPVLLASPLVEVKSALKDERRDDVMFTVTADQPITRWNVAVLGDYEGTVWTVGSSEGRSAAAEFRPVSADLVDRPDIIRSETQAISATVVIEDLTGPFIPTAGWADSVRFTAAPTPADPDLGTDGVALAQDRLRMNLMTGTVAVPTGIGRGLQYDIDVDVTPARSEDELATIDAPPLDGADELGAVPPPVRNLTADLVEGLSPGWSRVAAIRDRFVDDGFYDVSPVARPGHSYFRLAEFLAESDRLVGYEEQYAAAAATMVRVAELNSRIVVGYLVPEERYVAGTAEVRSSDLSAWIEVDFGQAGWVPVDVSPDRSREPTNEASGVTVQDVAVPNPPPPPPIPPTPEVFADEEETDEKPDDDEEDDDEEDETAVGSDLGIAATAGVAVGALVTVVALFAGLVVLWKWARRRRRRKEPDTPVAVALAWRETVDRYVETGVSVAPRSTPREVARALAADPGPGLETLVAVVERTAFHELPPGPADAEAAWSAYDAVARSIRADHSRLGRVRMATDVRPLRTRR